MNGKEIDKKFGHYFVNSVKAVAGWTVRALNSPAVPVADPTVDVSEQQHSVSCSFANGTLTINPDPAGDGLWIPYLGNGLGKEGDKGWGAFTRGVTNETWVATGPFSGCYSAAFDSPTGKRFAHLITPAAGYLAASVDEQITAISNLVGATRHQKWNMDGIGLGIVFFMRYDGAWHKRSVWVAPNVGTVMRTESNSSVF
jgi:hypothetical protein